MPVGIINQEYQPYIYGNELDEPVGLTHRF